MSIENNQNLAQLKRAVALQKLQQRNTARQHHAPMPTIPPADRDQPLPLSFAQQRLWFLDQLDHAAGAAYHMPVALRLRGRLDRSALQSTLNRIVARHENLRTTFVVVDGTPTQVIAPEHSGFLLIDHDLRDLDAGRQASAVATLGIDEARAPFDLAVGPLIRGRLLHVAQDEHVLLLTQHHIISDGWSTGILVKEVSALYTAFCQGQPDPLPPLAIQYADYAAWQRHWLHGDALQAQLDFWRMHLSGAPALLELPTDRPRSTLQTYAGDRVDVRLPAALTTQLRALSQRHGITVFMTLLAGWSVLLSRLSGQGEVVIGTPVANRQRSEIEPLIGFFVNTLALRIDLQSDPTVAELLAQVRKTTLDAYAHQDLPFEQVVETLQPERNVGYNPIFQAVLSLNNTAGGRSRDIALPGLALDQLATQKNTAHFDLELSLSDAGNAIEGHIAYASDLFNHATVQRFVGYLHAVLEGMENDDTRTVSRLPLLPPAERHQVLEGFNAAQAAFTQSSLIHQLFEAQAAAHPEADALIHDDQVLSYADLNQRANQVAHRLIALGVKPDERVAICVERSVEMIVGLLGILKAGAGYVPLDPTYPADRLAYMLDDSAPIAVLTQSALRSSLQTLDAIALPVVLLDDETLAQLPAHNPDVADHRSHHLAYVIYTSGSTGQPKGVMVEHGHVTRLFAATQRWFEFSRTDVWTLFHSFAFDFSVWEIWGALFHGGRLVVVPELCTRTPSTFYALLVRQRVTILNQTPSAFRALIQAQAESGAAHALRTVVFGGEALELHTLVPWIERNSLDRTQLVNMYGITEITVHATYRNLTQTDVRTLRTSPIGCAIPDLRMYVLDAQREPVPVGVTGELYVGGAGVARGYLNRAELTAERFLADPFSKDAGARLYKTGDLGRWLPDGTIEYLGRNDFQVKIRGFRIELGEIEARLCSCVGVREAVVIAREEASGDKRLVAYVVPDEGTELVVSDLRSALSQGLAEYMIPSAFVCIDALPLTPNGKLDRKALPAPDQSSLASRVYAAPIGDVEQTIAAIWQSLLGVERVGRNDHFFELGGHSLLVISLIERLRQSGLNIDVRTAFSAPTLSALAERLHAGTAAAAQADIAANPITTATTRLTPDLLPLVQLEQGAIDGIVANVPGGVANIQDIYPLAPLQEGILFHHLLDQTAGDAYLMRSVVAFDSRQRMDTFLQALQAVIDRHDILRSAVHWEGLPQPVQVVHRHATLPVHELALSPDAAVLPQLLAQTDPRKVRLDVRHAPILAAYVTRDAASGEWLLSLLRHHMVCDHVTMDLILSEIRLLLQGEGERLPKAMPYRNFIARTHAVPASEHEAYFRRTLGDMDEPTAPFGVLDVQGDGDAVNETRIDFSDELAQRIRLSARQHGVTPAVLFHVGWAQVLARCSGREDVVFGTVLSGRLQGSEGADRVVGMFINTLPIRIPLAGKNVGTAIGDTYARLSELLTHEQASLALAQRCSGVKPPLPLFTTLLNYRHGGTPASQQGWEGLRSLDSGERNNYPLTMSVEDRGAHFALTALFVPGVDGVRLTRYLETVMQSLVADAEAPLRDMDILPATERHQLLETFNATQSHFPHDQLIHELFEAQAVAQPEADAVMFEDQVLSYGALNQRANQVAHRLIALGVKPDDRVALCVERSVAMVVGLLGILKAGAGYVPLDPAYPADRLAYMLDDSAPIAVLTQSLLRTRLPLLEASVLPVVVLDDGSISTLPSHNPQVSGLAPEHLAYVIYTSGSTGQPKGVMVPHRGVVNYLTYASTAYLRADMHGALVATPLSFDATVTTLLVPWLTGKPVVLMPEDSQACLTQLLAYCRSPKPWLFKLTPSHLDALSTLMEVRASATRHLLVVGGEQLTRRCLDRFRARVLPGSVVVNEYGPTEAVVGCTTYFSESSERSASDAMPIGRPIANMRIYLLDTQRQPVPVGVTGELYIGGVGVTRGYLNRAELTAERFLADPFSKDAGARLYKTGDLGRWLPDGTIEYLGRNDFQVKIRGFRIELGEIEARLCSCVGVREAVVIAREEASGDKRLVAYVVPDEGTELVVSDLRSALSQGLAEYMIPSAFVCIDALPLTPNGKLDRKALPAPDQSSLASRVYAAPIGDVEQTIAAIWQSLLGVERVGRNDHFFELGGHSLLVISLIERLRQSGLNIDVRTAFSAPTLSALAERLHAGTAAAAQADIAANPITTATTRLTPDLLPLVQLEQGAIDGIVANVPGGVANIQDIYPLAPLQEGILFHHLLDQTAGDAYLMRSVVAFDSRQRMDTFLQALQAVIDRHDILRSAVHWEGLPQPVQVVHRHATLPVHELALSPDAAVLPQLLAQTDPRKVRLDVRHAPILAAYVTRDAASGEWLLSLLRHHMVCDHVTMDLILSEIRLLLQGEGERLPKAMPYRNFIARTHAVPASEHEAYFRRTLGDMDEPTAPFGVLDVQGDGDAVNETRIDFSDELAQRIRLSARQHGVTPAVLFHVGWAQVLARCSGREDVVFGTVLSGRLQGSEGADRVVGMFINTLPIRIPLAGKNVGTAIGDTYARLSELLTHEQASLALAQRCSGVKPPLPLFTTLLNYRYRHAEKDAGDTLASVFAWEGARVLSSGETRNNYPLTMSVEDWGQAFGLTALFVPGIDGVRLTRYLEAAMEALVEDMQRPMRDVRILPTAERHQVLRSFNATTQDFPRERLIHELFEAQAVAQPDADAVMFEDQVLSYGALNRRANQVAHQLIALGVKPDERVAICVERNVEMIVGLLGILKAGAGYVPLDPAYPADRLAYMLDDSAPIAVLTQSALRSSLPLLDAAAIAVIVLDDAALSLQPDTDPKRLQSDRHLAYVIYTSGSTGQPKGVMVEHRNAVNFWEVMRQTTHRDCAPRSRVALNAAFSFDMSLKGILQLLSGHCLVLIPQTIRANGPAMMDFIDRYRIDAMDSTPSQLEVLLAAGLIDKPGHRPVSVLLGGEAIGKAMWAKLKACTSTLFYNMYGPTECTVDATIVRIRDTHGGPVIGKPIANTQVYLLDAHRQPVPVGVPGELYLGGVQVARGYLNRAELTAERFLADPFSKEAGARLYKTGDLGRWLPDGTIEYLGRNDFQVKIRGFRIELGEIEAKLTACAGVREAVVIAREEASGDKRLVAYVVPDEGTELVVSDLRSALSQGLAEYMIPSAFVCMDALPLTPNGKLDRKALPAPDQSSLASRVYAAPIGDVEQTIAAIWQSLLGVERVGRNDHFFELGGHSLLAVQMVTRIREQFHVDIPLRELFEQPTLSVLSDSVRALQLEVFLGNDLEGMQSELDGLSAEELQSILEQESTHE